MQLNIQPTDSRQTVLLQLNKAHTRPIVAKSYKFSRIYEFSCIYLKFLKFPVLEKRLTVGPTDRRMDGWMMPLIELLFETNKLVYTTRSDANVGQGH